MGKTNELKPCPLLEKIVARLRGEFTNLIPDERPSAIVYNMGYAAAIRDLEHIVEDVIEERRGEDGKSEQISSW